MLVKLTPVWLLNAVKKLLADNFYWDIIENIAVSVFPVFLFDFLRFDVLTFTLNYIYGKWKYLDVHSGSQFWEKNHIIRLLMKTKLGLH